MKYSVWLFTRPLSYASYFSSLEDTSEGKDQLRHWGILVTDTMSRIDVQTLRVEYGAVDGTTELGAFYELFREPNNLNNVKITRPLTLSTINREWRNRAVEFVGETDKTHEEIRLEGTQLYSNS